MRLRMIPLATLLAATAAAETRHVPAEYPTIRAGIDAALAGDVVLVADGVYTGPDNKNLSFNGKAITVRSESGAASCVIDCEGDGRGFVFDNTGETAESVVEGFTIQNGNASHGGGIFIMYAGPTIRACVLKNNADSGIYAWADPNEVAPLVVDCVFVGNFAENFGGGAYIRGGRIVDCVISGNRTREYSSSGGGLYLRDARLERSVVAGNESSVAAGVFLGERSEILASVLIGNRSDNRGGGVFVSPSPSVIIRDCLIAGNWAFLHGGGIDAGLQEIAVNGCTIVGNYAGSLGGGIHLTGRLLLRDSIIRDNEAMLGRNIAIESASGVQAAYCAIADGPNSVFGFGGSYYEWLTPNIAADPPFVDPAGPDGDPATWEDNDYRLSAGSPCIDAGNPALAWNQQNLLDAAGRIRVWDGDADGIARVDIGALEYGASCRGDADGDGTIGLADLAILLGAFGGSGGAQAGDTNADGLVALDDLAVVLGGFGTSCD